MTGDRERRAKWMTMDSTRNLVLVLLWIKVGWWVIPIAIASEIVAIGQLILYEWIHQWLTGENLAEGDSP